MNSNKRLTNQAGISLVTVLSVIVFIAVTIIFSTAVLPPAISHYNVNVALKAVADDPSMSRMRRSQLREAIQNQFRINNVTDEAKKALVITKKSADDGALLATVAYEVRKDLYMNIDVVMTYKSELHTDRPDLCCKVK